MPLKRQELTGPRQVAFLVTLLAGFVRYNQLTLLMGF